MGNFLLGLGVGLAAGVLFAPKAGLETRGMIGSKANEGVDYLKRQSNEGVDYVKRHTQELRDSAMDAVEKGKGVVNRQVEKLASSQEAAASVYQR